MAFAWLVTTLLVASLACTSAQPGNYCGATYGDAAKCTGTPCPDGTDAPCGGGACFAIDTCSSGSGGGGTPGGGGADSSGGPGNYCGDSYEAAAKCTAPCASGTDGDCSGGAKCFAVDTCGDGSADGGGGAPAECGRQADGEECPLRACCSKWGFCGWTSEFCEPEADCQSNCGTVLAPPPDPPGAAAAAMSVRWGYWESWSLGRDCSLPQPPLADMAIGSYTHLAFSFAHVSADHKLVLASADDAKALSAFTALKGAHPGLKLVVAVGGWAFNDPPTQTRFSDMSATAASRATFVSSVISFLDEHNLDGIDVDWEYPGADDRGGTPADTENYTKLVAELREALGGSRTLTLAVPLSAWCASKLSAES